MRKLLVPLVIALAAIGAQTQHHTAGYFSVTWAGLMLKTDALGTVTSAAMPTNSSHYQCEMGLGNQYVLVADASMNAIWQIDPATVSVIGTLATPNIGGTVYGMNFDHNGDLYLAYGTTLIKVDPRGNSTTITSPQRISHMGIDPWTGDLIINNGSALYTMDRNGTNAVQIGTGFSSRYGDLVKDPVSGDIYVPTCCGWSGQSMHVLQNGSSVATVALASNDLAGAYGPNLDRLSDPQPRLITGSHVFASQYPNSGGMWAVDLQTMMPTRLANFQTRTIADSTILYSRNVQPVRTAPGKYQVLLNFDAEGLRNYVVGMSFNGITPMTTLPDQRRVPLVFDDLTVLTTNGLAAPFVTNTVGQLDALGTASALIDVSSIYAAVQGVRIWIIAITLENSAPLGIGTISDPAILVFD